MTPRGWAVLALVCLCVAIAVMVAVIVPWSVSPPSRADQLAAVADLPGERVARGKQFHAALRPGSYTGMLVGLGVALLLGLTPLGARLVVLMGRPFGGHWLAEALLGGLAVVLIGQLATAPFAAWRHVVLGRYGLSTQDWSGWALDMAKSLLLSGALALVVLAGFYTLTRLAPRWWWVWAAVGAAGLTVLLSLAFPVLVEPVFNKFTPMQASPLRTELMALAERDGTPARGVLVADASRRTRAVNAYVSGFGPTRRIVVYDTLLEAAPDAEVKQVVAHELGHAKNRDVVIGTALGGVGAAAGVCAIYLLGGWGGLLRRAGLSGESSDLTDPRAVALLVAVIAVAGLLGAPAQSAVSRQLEMRADRHALALTHDPAGFEAMQRRLALRNLSDVDPPVLEHWLFGSHPTTAQRIAAARAAQ